jgi:acetyl-CoA carboxylase carboxyltransferase component
VAALGGGNVGAPFRGRVAGAQGPVRNDCAMPPAPELTVTAPFAGVVVAVEHAPGGAVSAGAPLVVLEAMKMEHEILAAADGVVRRVEVAIGDAVQEGAVLVVLDAEGVTDGDGGPAGADDETTGADGRATAVDLASAAEASAAASVNAGAGAAQVGAATGANTGDASRADLQAVRERHALGLDAARPEAVARRRARGRRTARENLAELVDEGTYVEYGPLIFAAQERRRAREELIAQTPADGLVAGVGEVDGHPCVAMSYDYTVLAGTQGMRGHLKKDRLFELAERRRLPVVLFAEGGGGRPGDVDWPHVAGLDCRAFHLFARLSGRVPLVGIASGYCFAGNAALLGCCDVIIATEDASIGMGGPAMIEGGGLGVYEPGAVGPIEVQHANGVVDLRVADDRAAVAAARRYLSYFHGPSARFDVPDQSALRTIVPERRKRAYEVRRAIEALCDERSVLELRDGYGAGIVTALATVAGRALGIVANDPAHLGGAIDGDGADKAARFLTLCDAFSLPVLFLCDTPGFMVGPEAERTATVRRCARLFTVGANLAVPFGTIVLRKGYGLGAQAMAGGSFKAPLFTVGWPTSEFGGMGLEGAVRLGMRRELDAIADDAERERVFQATVAAAYEHGRGLEMAAYGEIDDVIDPADSRRWIATLFDPPPQDWRRLAVKRRPNVEVW